MNRRLAAALLVMAAFAGVVSGLISVTHRVTEGPNGRLVTCGRTLVGGGSDPLCHTFDGWRWMCTAGLAVAACLVGYVAVSLVRRHQWKDAI